MEKAPERRDARGEISEGSRELRCTTEDHWTIQENASSPEAEATPMPAVATGSGPTE